MKKLVLACALTFIAMSAYAKDVACVLWVNSEYVSETRMVLEPMVKKLFEKSDNFRFYITSLGDSKYEIEVYNPNEPSRSYTSGYLRTEDDRLEWALLSTDSLFEILCRLESEKK